MAIDTFEKIQADLRQEQLASALFHDYEEQLMTMIKEIEKILIDAAEQLVKGFRDRKQALHEQLSLARPIGAPRSADGYSKLQMFWRYRDGCLQITWQEVHIRRGTKKPLYKSIPFHTRRGYVVRRLQAMAGYAADLVGEYEPRATQLRMYWSSLQDIKRATRTAMQRLPNCRVASTAHQAARDGHVPRASHFPDLGDGPVPRTSQFAPLGEGPVPRNSQFAALGEGPVPQTSQFAPLGEGPVPRNSQFAPLGEGPVPRMSQFLDLDT